MMKFKKTTIASMGASLAAIVLLSVGTSDPAEARIRHRVKVSHHGHHARHVSHARHPRYASNVRHRRWAYNAFASADPASSGISGGYSSGFGSSNVVAEARRYIGGNPTGRRSLWCGAFMDMVLKRTGHAGGGNLARGYASYGRRVSGPQVGALAVMSRGKGGGHVGVVSGIDGSGNPIIISGNHGGRVAESTYPRGRIYAYVMP